MFPITHHAPHAARFWNILIVMVIGVIVCALASQAAGALGSPDQLRWPKGQPLIFVDDLEMQLRLVYRDNLPEFTKRNDQLKAALAAWNASAKTEADRKQMETWLLNGIRNSMPGTYREMPEMPVFADRANTSASMLKSHSDKNATDDPFRDDPPSEQLFRPRPRPW